MRRRDARRYVVGRLGLAAALGVATLLAVQAAVGAPSAQKSQHRARSQYPVLLSHWALKRVKPNVDRTAWEYQLKVAYPGGQSRRYPALRPQDAIPGVKVAFNLPQGMNVKPAGRFKIRGSAGVIVRSVRAGHSQTLKFWADPMPPNMPQRCFTTTAQSLAQTGQPIANAPQQTAKACVPKAPPVHAGPEVLDHFYYSCTADLYPNCIHDGVIKVRLTLDDECGGCYPYKNGIPYRVVFYIPKGSQFSGRVRIAGWVPGYPKPTKADKQWHWQAVQGVLRPVLTYSNLVQGVFVEMDATITVQGSPAQECLGAVATPLVWLPPIQSVTNQCVTDPSATTTTTTTTTSSP